VTGTTLREGEPTHTCRNPQLTVGDGAWTLRLEALVQREPASLPRLTSPPPLPRLEQPDRVPVPAMGAIVNGLAAHGGFIPYGSTFLIFSDYMRPPIRLAALMRLHVVHVYTHDSIALGEDGPTHQPVEQLANLRAIPDLIVIRLLREYGFTVDNLCAGAKALLPQRCSRSRS
jgi:Transketolase, pyrimidine binding domain